MPPLSGSWANALKGEFSKDYYKKLFQTVGAEYKTHTIYPPADDIFNAFHFTPLEQVKVVILGQDPYHEPGQAHGLGFAVKPEVSIPPSLGNIYKALEDDLGCYIPNNGYLEKWSLFQVDIVTLGIVDKSGDILRTEQFQCGTFLRRGRAGDMNA